MAIDAETEGVSERKNDGHNTREREKRCWDADNEIKKEINVKLTGEAFTQKRKE